MSFSDFKEVSINNPGTSTTYGSDDVNEIMRIFNDKVISNRKVRIKNEWEFTDHLDIKAPGVIPGNPGANSKRMYVDPNDLHLKAKSTGGTVIDFDILAQGSVGEANTASNVGTGGFGLFKQKTSLNLEFRKLNVASNKLSVALDTGNDEIDLDVIESNLLLQNMSGTLTVSRGGTGVATFPANSLLRGNGTSPVANIATGTNGQILTMVAGAPAWANASASSDVKAAVFDAGVQVGTVGRRLNFSIQPDFAVTEDAGNDFFNIALNRREVCVASWTGGTAGLTKTNVGTTYVDVFPSQGDGVGTDVDAYGGISYRFYVSWSKNGGLGTHSCRVVDQAGTNVLAEITNCVNGRNVVTGSIPAFYLDNTRSIKLQMKASNTTDDPVFGGAHLYYK
jgi:hypothetical protein